MPEGQNQPLACGQDRIEPLRILDLPAQSRADQPDDPISQLGDQSDLETVECVQAAAPVFTGAILGPFPLNSLRSQRQLLNPDASCIEECVGYQGTHADNRGFPATGRCNLKIFHEHGLDFGCP